MENDAKQNYGQGNPKKSAKHTINITVIAGIIIYFMNYVLMIANSFFIIMELLIRKLFSIISNNCKLTEMCLNNR